MRLMSLSGGTLLAESGCDGVMCSCEYNQMISKQSDVVPMKTEAIKQAPVSGPLSALRVNGLFS